MTTFDETKVKRQSAGTSAGGQFVEHLRSAPSSSLLLEDESGTDETNWGSAGISVGSRTPWGVADHVYAVAPGIAIAGTPGHGGVKLSCERNAVIPPALRNSSGWYEEDCEYWIAARYFPGEFASQKHLRERYTAELMAEEADQSIKQWFPEKWMAANGRELEPGESREWDQKVWERENANNFVAVSKSPSASSPSMVVVSAKRSADGATAEYLVPSEEYDSKRFVIDPAKHPKLPPREVAEKPKPKIYRTEPIDFYEIRRDRSLTGSAVERIGNDLDKRWRLSNGEVLSLQDILESHGTTGLSAWAEGARTKYTLGLEGGGSIPLSKATWDYLSRSIPDTRSEQDKVSQAYQVASAKLDAFTEGQNWKNWRDPKAKARAEKLDAESTRLYEELTALRKKAASEQIAKNGTYAERTARERAEQAERERAARIEV